MKLLLKKIIIAAFVICTGCTSHKESSLSSQSMLAVNWIQQSGEYDALSWQAFNIAQYIYDTSKVPAGKNKAVIVDIDETVLNNSAYQAWLVKNNETYDEKTWLAWVHDRQATAMPGAEEFAKHVIATGGRIFYITNRDASAYNSTAENLRNQGFPDITPETLLPMMSNTSDKAERIEHVIQKGYIPVVYIGDNLNDFSSETYQKDNNERRNFVIRNNKKFGTKFIILLNPSYGDWEGGLDKNYWKVTPEERKQIRYNNLRPWLRSSK
ncbi:5'-nucleotidase, lipoprotein e(P4) family [Escherichia fergusonii]|nr:5'-nucleotidase, lipoprotein e(P4) family [Escherichia fergusonii]